MTVRKIRVDADLAGGDTDYWEDEWSGIDLEAARRLVAGDPVMRLLGQYLPNDGPVLEAGCGSGAIAAALADCGHAVVGVDLAARALLRAASMWPDFIGAVGDVCRMPFPDGTFAAIVSLGVLEHEESGPAPGLREHFRVLRPGGLLLVTVPRISPLKATRDTWNLRARSRETYRSRGRWVVRRERTEVETSARPFHQYEFSHRDWVRRVRDAGFEVVAVRSHLVGAGLGDIPFLSRPHGAAVCHAATDPPLAEAPVGGSGASGVRGGLGRLKRAAIDERGDNLMERLVARSAQGLVGHMVLTVARRPDRLV